MSTWTSPADTGGPAIRLRIVAREDAAAFEARGWRVVSELERSRAHRGWAVLMEHRDQKTGIRDQPTTN